MNARTLAQKAQGLAELHGGFTLEPLTGDVPPAGYAVGGCVQEVRIPWNSLASYGIEDFILANKDSLVDGYGHLGGWVDGNELVLDVCSIDEDLVTAELIALAAGEESYFDLEKKETVYVKYTT